VLPEDACSNRTVSPVSNVTVIVASDVTDSLSVAVMFIVVPALYEPFEVVEEKLVRVGAVVSGVAAIALVRAEVPVVDWVTPLTVLDPTTTDLMNSPTSSGINE